MSPLAQECGEPWGSSTEGARPLAQGPDHRREPAGPRLGYRGLTGRAEAGIRNSLAYSKRRKHAGFLQWESPSFLRMSNIPQQVFDDSGRSVSSCGQEAPQGFCLSPLDP